MTRKQWAPWLLFGGPIVVFTVWAVADNSPLYFKTLLSGLTLASLYFLVASGFTLVFGLMRNVNLAHGSLYLFGAYVGWFVGEHTGSWLLAVAAGFLSSALLGLLMQLLVFRHMQGQDLRQTLVTIGLSTIAHTEKTAIGPANSSQSAIFFLSLTPRAPSAAARRCRATWRTRRPS